LKTPVVLIIFNRPSQTSQVFEAIAKVKPKVLLVIGDGPREQVVGEAQSVAECRKILDRITWPCDVLTNFSEVNLGCRNRVSTGLNWVFSNVDEAIILEDDCVPSEDFFRFASDLLAKYKHDERVGTISGSSSSSDFETLSESYHFSSFPAIWGWATWSRVWNKYNASIPSWPEKRRDGLLNDVLQTRRAIEFWRGALDGVHSQRIDTWDYQLALLLWTEGYLSVIPNRNLISNIGFGPGATHTLDPSSAFANVAIEEMAFPLTHPAAVSRNLERDLDVELTKFAKPRHIVYLTKLFEALPEIAKKLIRQGYVRLLK